MGQFTYRDGLSVFQLIFFLPCWIIASYLWKRDGFGPGSASWRFAATFSSLRVTGPICALIAINHYSSGLGSAIATSQVVGIPPLTIACITMADRINFDRKIVPNFVFLIIIITSLVALILGIIGAEKALDGTNFKPNALIKAAMGTFLFLYFCLVSLVVVFGIHYKSYTDKVHRRAYKAMAFATPFLGVKQLYAALGDYSHDPVFSTFGGNTTVYLLLNVLMEMFATGIILGFGLTFGKPPVSPKPTADIEAQKEEQTKSPRLSYIPAEALQFGARFSRALAPWAHGDQYSNRASSIYPQDGESKDLPPLPSFPTIFSPYPQRDCSTPEDRYAVGKDGSVSVRNQRRSLLRAGTSSSQRFPVVAKQESPEMVHASPSLRQRYPNGVAVGGQTRMWREQTIPPPEYRREQSTEDMYGLRQEWREQQGGWREEGGEERIDWAPAGVEPRYF